MVFRHMYNSGDKAAKRCCGSGAERGTADGGHRLLSLPDGQVSLRFSLEGRLSKSHLGLVFRRLKPFLISAKRWSMMQSSSGGTKAFLTGNKGEKRALS